MWMHRVHALIFFLSKYQAPIRGAINVGPTCQRDGAVIYHGWCKKTFSGFVVGSRDSRRGVSGTAPTLGRYFCWDGHVADPRPKRWAPLARLAPRGRSGAGEELVDVNEPYIVTPFLLLFLLLFFYFLGYPPPRGRNVSFP